MKKVLLLTGIILYCSGMLQAQENRNNRNKIYETWVRLNSSSYPLNGVLYEIKDSSIIISTSKYKYDVAAGKYLTPPIYYHEINNIKARRPHSIAIGAIAGAALGVFIPLFALSEKNTEIPASFTFAFISLPLGTLGGGMGALFGYLKRDIPVYGSFEQFSRNKSRLRKYSYLNEKSQGLNTYEREYEHKAYFSLSSGISIPFGDFADKSLENTNGDSAMIAGGSTFSFGYRINNKLGISVSLFNDQYNVFRSSGDRFFMLTGVTGGPLLSTKVSDKLYFDLKPAIGYGGLEESASINGVYTGLLMNINASITFNFSKRWCLLTEAGYLTSNLKSYTDGKKLNAINMLLGIGYRFK